MRGFYVSLVHGCTINLALGPFLSEVAARKYEAEFMDKTSGAPAMEFFEDHNVISIPAEECGPNKVGPLNYVLDIDPADLLPGFAKAAIN